MSTFSYQQPGPPPGMPGPQPGMPGMPGRPGMPGMRPSLVQRKQRSGGDAFNYRWSRIWRNIVDGPWRSFGIIISNALGVAISIAIIAAAEGIQTKINKTLTNCGAGSACAQYIDITTIHNVLTETRSVLINLAIVSTAAIVGLVTWITISQRRRAISLQVQEGQRRNDLIVEFLGEALVLCVVGGVLGIFLGFMLCSLIESSIPLLPMNPQVSSIVKIFPITTLLAFATTAGISSYFAANTDARVKL